MGRKAPRAGERDGQNMKYWEYGRENPELLVMFHGGGTSYLGAQPAAVLLGERFHVILVAYDGFNPPPSRRPSSARPRTRPGGWGTM